MAILPLALLAPLSRSGPVWHGCAGDSGGALHARVVGMSCREASVITERGLTPDLRHTRFGGLVCSRHRRDRLWSYRCVGRDGARRLSFDTF
jgi:hypothetical protein